LIHKGKGADKDKDICANEELILDCHDNNKDTQGKEEMQRSHEVTWISHWVISSACDVKLEFSFCNETQMLCMQ